MKRTTKNIEIKNNATITSVKLATVEAPKVDYTRIQRQTGNIVYWGDKKNSWLYYLIATASKSTEHQALLDSKRKYIFSGGLTVTGDNAEAVETFLKSLTNRKKHANEILKGFSRNYPYFEIAYFEVIYARGLKSIVSVTPIDSTKILPNKGVDKYGNVIDYTFCADFKNLLSEGTEVIPAFDISKPAPKQIAALYISDLQQPYFPNISYTPALNYIETAYSVSTYLLSYMKNSMTASGIISFDTDGLSEEQVELIDNSVQDAFTTEENAGRIIVIGKDKVTFTPLTTADNTSFLDAINNIVISKICSTHKANPLVAAISKDGSGFSNTADEINEAIRNFYIDQIQPAQNMFLDFINEILEFNKFTDYELSIITPAKLKPEIPEFVLEQLSREKWAKLYDLELTDFEGEAGTDTENDVIN